MHTLMKSVPLSPKYPPIEALHTPDHLSGAAIRSLCHFLSISSPSQLNRIRRQPDLAAALHFVTIDTDNGPRAVAMLEGYAIAIWATGLQTSRLSPEKQEAVALLKQHAHTAIARAFSQPDVETASATAFAAPAPETMPASPAWDRVIAGMEEVIDGLREVKAGHASMDQRILLLEQDRLGRRLGSGAKLSAAQIGQLFMQLALLREQVGIPIEDAERQLAAQFGVAHLTDVDAAQWEALVTKVHALFT